MKVLGTNGYVPPLKGTRPKIRNPCFTILF